MLTRNAQELSKYPSGGLAQISSLSLPLIASLFSGSLMGFCDRIFVGRISSAALEGLSLAIYLSLLFQTACIRISSVNQIFIASDLGKGKKDKGGVYTWQMIWFSLFSLAITLPLGWGIRFFIFPQTNAGELGKEYFTIMMGGNFLFPLGATLGAFFIGQGKTRFIKYIAISSHLINIGLNYILIFGWGCIYPMGVKGAAYATLAAQGVYCTLLAVLFMRKNSRVDWGTNKWKFRKDVFLESLKLGVPRSLARFSALLAWNAAVYFISLKGGDYLLVLSVGSSIYILISCFNEGMGQALITLFSYLKEKGGYPVIKKGLRGSFLFLCCSFLLMSLPLIFFQDRFIFFFLHEEIPKETLSYLRLACFWIWIFFWFEGFAWIGLSLMTALGRTLYLLKMNLVINWPTIFIPMFLGIHFGNCGPDKIWLISIFSCITAGFLCLYKGISVLRQNDRKSQRAAFQSS